MKIEPLILNFSDGFFFFFLKKHTAGRKIQTQITRDSEGVSTFSKESCKLLMFPAQVVDWNASEFDKKHCKICSLHVYMYSTSEIVQSCVGNY